MIVSSYHLVDDRPESIAPIYTGYPSVDTKARDTFISLPGLLLATGREEVAAKTLKYWLEIAEKNGWVMPENSPTTAPVNLAASITDSGSYTRRTNTSRTIKRPPLRTEPRSPAR